MDELTLLLQRFSNEVVEASRQISRNVIAFCMNSVIQLLLARIGEADVRMKCYAPEPTENCFEAMKASSNSEFELLVVLDQLTSIKTFYDLAETNPNFACYGQVIVQHANMCVDDLCVPETSAGHRNKVLSAVKVREYFAQIAAKVASVTSFHGASVQVTYKGKSFNQLLFIFIITISHRICGRERAQISRHSQS